MPHPSMKFKNCQYIMRCSIEGIVAKKKGDPHVETILWLKIRNKHYSQWIGRPELFERERKADPDVDWTTCTLACEAMK